MNLVFLVIAIILFFLAAVGQTVLSQPPHDLVAWGLMSLALALLLGGVGWASGRPIIRKE